MSRQAIKNVAEQVSEIIIDQVACSREQITPAAEFSTDLGFDSLDQVEFVMKAEEAFNIQIPDEEADDIRTVQQAIDKIEKAIRH